MTEPHLILHKVYGEPQFDIAHPMLTSGDPNPWWICSTSGWRAYPIAVWPLEAIFPNAKAHSQLAETNDKWPDLREHFVANPEVQPKAAARPTKFTATLDDLENL